MLKRKVLTLRDGDEVWKLKAKRRSEKQPLFSCIVTVSEDTYQSIMRMWNYCG